MQNRYVGDVGDYAKYALLRCLTTNRQMALRLGVVWYFFPDEAHNSDGRHTSYLGKPGYRSLDAELFDALKRIVKDQRRSISDIPKRRLLPNSTVYFDEIVAPKNSHASNPKARLEFRAAWLQRAVAATGKCALVFLDPDNGLEVQSVPKYAPKAGKYAFWDELSAFWDRGQSLVIYHHLNRRCSAVDQTEQLRDRFANRLGKPGLLLPLLFRRGSCRHFWVVGQTTHAAALISRVEALLASGWDRHFEVL